MLPDFKLEYCDASNADCNGRAMISGYFFKTGLFQIYETGHYNRRKYYSVVSAGKSIQAIPTLVHLANTDQVVTGLTDASKWNIKMGSGESLEAVGVLLILMIDDVNLQMPDVLLRFYGIVKLTDSDIAVRWGKQRKVPTLATGGYN